MPSVYAHLRFGEEVVKALPSYLSDFIETYPEAFALGTQGPDLLFYHDPFQANELRARASYFHDISGNEFFLPQAKKFLESKGESIEKSLENNGAYAAFLCGCLCHFTLDAVCHPYVEELISDSLTHVKIESEFDKFLLRLDGKPIRGYNTATPILNRNGAAEAASKALDAPLENVALAIKTMRKMNKLFSYPCEAVHAFIHFYLKIKKREAQFGGTFLHKKDDPLCIEGMQVLNELWNQSVPKAVSIIQAFFENLETFAKTGEFTDELFRLNFGGIIKTEET